MLRITSEGTLNITKYCVSYSRIYRRLPIFKRLFSYVFRAYLLSNFVGDRYTTINRRFWGRKVNILSFKRLICQGMFTLESHAISFLASANFLLDAVCCAGLRQLQMFHLSQNFNFIQCSALAVISPYPTQMANR